MRKRSDLERWAGRPITRRQMLKGSVFGAAGLLLCDGLVARVLAGGDAGAVPRPVAARAKSVIQVWLWGGPSHLDTFDPKPEAGEMTRSNSSTLAS